MTEFLPLKVDLPSKYMFYPTMKELYVRKLTIGDYKRYLHLLKTSNKKTLFNGLVNHIQGCCSEDISNLTIWDFIYLIFYIREISFPKQPIIVSWMSRYGNLLESKINVTKLNIINPTITQPELNTYLLKGYVVPRVKDVNEEIFEDIIKNNLANPGKNIYDHIEIFFKGNNEEERTAFMEEYSKDMDLTEIVDEISEFYKKISHGIEEYFYAKDEGFNPRTWEKKLEEKITQLETYISTATDMASATMTIAVKNKLSNELSILKEKLEKGDSVEPVTEKIFLPKGYEVLVP